jgi:hypothetical protein
MTCRLVDLHSTDLKLAQWTVHKAIQNMFFKPLLRKSTSIFTQTYDFFYRGDLAETDKQTVFYTNIIKCYVSAYRTVKQKVVVTVT